jgi:hypothetical protein
MWGLVYTMDWKETVTFDKYMETVQNAWFSTNYQYVFTIVSSFTMLRPVWDFIQQHVYTHDTC